MHLIIVLADTAAGGAEGNHRSCGSCCWQLVWKLIEHPDVLQVLRLAAKLYKHLHAAAQQATSCRAP